MRCASGRLGSARVSHVGERVLAIADFPRDFQTSLASRTEPKPVSARRRNQHARRVRYPDAREVASGV
jgi:hypothetical protein